MIFRVGSFRLRAIPRLLALAGASFFAPLTNSLTLARGTGSPTFTRATTAMQQDGDGKYNQVLAGEARFQGMRRVRNLLTASENIVVGAVWTDVHAGTGLSPVVTSGQTDPLGGITAFRVQLNRGVGDTAGDYSILRVNIPSHTGAKSAWIKSNTGSSQSVCLLAGQPAFTVTAAWQRMSQIDVATTAFDFSNYGPTLGTRAVDVLVWHPSDNDVTGQSNQNPSEYVPSTWNDTGAAGVRYFPYANNNTVDPVTHVVTEAQGAALPRAGKGNYLSEAAATNIALWCRDFTNAAWTKTNITPTLTATGIDGVANSASTLTATAINGTALQAVTLASSTRAQSAFVRRRTGVGAISMTTDGGTTYTDITAQLGATFALVQITQAAVTNPSFGFKMATSGDAIDVDFAQNETGTFATSPILTTTVAVTRAQDILSYPSAGNALAIGTMYAEFNPYARTAISQIIDLGNAAASVNVQSSGIVQAALSNVVPLLSSVSTATLNASNKIGYAYSSGNFSESLNGAAPVISSNATAPAIPTAIYIGNNSTSAQLTGTIGNVRIWPTQLPNATLQALTAP